MLVMTVALVAAGCGTAAHDQALAHAKAWARTHREPTDVDCSSGFKSPAGMSTTPDFICLIRHTAADCDELHLTQDRGRWTVRLQRRGVDCVRPL
jgi:hypothetical protein